MVSRRLSFSESSVFAACRMDRFFGAAGFSSRPFQEVMMLLMMLRSLKSTNHGTTFRLHQVGPPVFSFFFSSSLFLISRINFSTARTASSARLRLLKRLLVLFYFCLFFFFFAFSAQEMPLCYKIPPISVCVCVCLLHLCVYLMCSMENKAGALARRCGPCPLLLLLLHNSAKALPYIQPL